MELKSIYDLYLMTVQGLYDAEQQILQTLPRLAAAVHSRDLQAALEEHVDQTRTHIARLEQIFDHIGLPPRAEVSKGMRGILEECEDMLALAGKAEARDAAIIGLVQRIEHFEIAVYGCAKTYAGLLGEDASEELLEETLMEESDSDQMLTDLAESFVNEEAMAS